MCTEAEDSQEDRKGRARATSRIFVDKEDREKDTERARERAVSEGARLRGPGESERERAGGRERTGRRRRALARGTARKS
eukprot:750191-Hanusia_phi.AAC.1